MRAARLMLLALVLAPAAALSQPKGNPRLASLEIDIWPEYDRAGAALVILKAELAPEAALPAKVSLRLPKASGGPSAVAYFGPGGGTPLNLAHRVEESAGALMVRLETPERNFLVELYEPFPSALPARSYTYTWPGDLAADRVTVSVQEPATASGIEMQPKLDKSFTGKNGLRYLTAELGPQPEGKSLPVAVSYTKSDLRTSAEILNLKGSAPAAAAPAAAAASPSAGGAKVPVELILAMLGVAVAAASAVLLYARWKGRSPPPGPLPRGACTQCGAPRRGGDRYCGRCGAKLA